MPQAESFTPGYGEKFAVSSDYLSPLDRPGHAAAAKRVPLGGGELFPVDYDGGGKPRAGASSSRSGAKSASSGYGTGAGGEISPITTFEDARPRLQGVGGGSAQGVEQRQAQPAPTRTARASAPEASVFLFHYTGDQMGICGGRVAKGKRFCTKSHALCLM